MLIEKLRITDTDSIETDEGKVFAPPTYFMDVALNEQESVAVPISQTTYQVLHDLYTSDETPFSPGYIPGED